MGRPRAFDEEQAVRAAAELFAVHGYEGTSVDDLVTGLGVHRGSLYKVFGSKRGLYLAALRRHLDEEVLPLAAALTPADGLPAVLTRAVAAFDGGPAAGLLLSAAVERAGSDPEVGELVAEGLAALDGALGAALARAGGGHPAAPVPASAPVPAPEPAGCSPRPCSACGCGPARASAGPPPPRCSPSPRPPSGPPSGPSASPPSRPPISPPEHGTHDRNPLGGTVPWPV